MTVLTPPRTDTYKAAALAWVQEITDCQQLPKGERMMADRCPIALAIGMHVDQFGAYSSDPDGEEYVFPILVSEFVRRFDDGEYPELDLGMGE